MFQEIKRPASEDGRPVGKPCPYCNTFTRYGMIACPEGRSGCLVVHYGWSCPTCGRDFHEVNKE